MCTPDWEIFSHSDGAPRTPSGQARLLYTCYASCPSAGSTRSLPRAQLLSTCNAIPGPTTRECPAGPDDAAAYQSVIPPHNTALPREPSIRERLNTLRLQLWWVATMGAGNILSNAFHVNWLKVLSVHASGYATIASILSTTTHDNECTYPDSAERVLRKRLRHLARLVRELPNLSQPQDRWS